jgi:hypothetical protein
VDEAKKAYKKVNIYEKHLYIFGLALKIHLTRSAFEHFSELPEKFKL